MDRSKKARAPVRAATTRTINEVTAELAKDPLDDDELQLKLSKLQKLASDLAEWDLKVKDGMLDEGCTDDEYQSEMLVIEEYEDKIRATKRKIEKVLTHAQPISPQHSHHSTTTEGGNKKTYKLPKIEIKKFNGELTEWLSFWSQFQKINDDDELHASDKFQYLVQSMTPGTRASELVQSYPQTAQNYPKVVTALEERFGKKKLLKQVYVRELLRMIINNAKNRENAPLSKLHDRLESHLRALESLGVSTEQSAEFLFPMVESSLPEDILIAWQRSPNFGRDGANEVPPTTELDYLMKFLRQEVEGEEQRHLARSGFSEKRSDPCKEKKNLKPKLGKDQISTAASLHTGNEKISCIFCDKPHPSQECMKAQGMSFQEKRDMMKIKKACFNCCRPEHGGRFCKAHIKCTGCGGRHYHLVCPASQKNAKEDEKKNETVTTNVSSNNVQGGLVLLKTLLVRIATPTSNKVLRVLLDDGSQKSYIASHIVQEAKCQVLGSSFERNSLFGGILTDIEKRTSYQVPLESLDGKNSRILKLTDKTRIASDIPNLPRGPWLKELKTNKIWINDCQAKDKEVDILIGADLMPQLTTGKSMKLKCGLEAIQTIFGWTLMGPLPVTRDSAAMTVAALSVQDFVLQQLWDLETLGIRDPVEMKMKLERELEAHQHFANTVTRNPDGRYCVSLPWVGGVQNIPDNRAVAEKRLQSTTRKLKSNEQFDNYDAIFKQWELEGFIEDVARDEKSTVCHYIPHRPVYKPESKTTPVRPVFDASCKVGRNPSLNDCLEKGPNLIELLPTIMMRFREGRIGIVSDIRKAFQMIGVEESEKDFLRFLWWEDGDCNKIKIYRHARVVFGVNSSPFLLAAVIGYHLDHVPEEDKEVARKLMKSLYVDNCVTSVNNAEEYYDFKKDATRIMGDAKMDLREWEHGPVGCGTEAGHLMSSVLGMKWDRHADVLVCEAVPNKPEEITKRTVLSTVSQIFDPMGFLSPAMIYPKVMLQEAWAHKLDWDSELPEDIKMRFETWMNELKSLEDVSIMRCFMGSHPSEVHSPQYHVFCDASKLGYSSAVFIRVPQEDGSISVQLLQAKARVAPLKKSTIPRLELIGCVIAARLAHSVQNTLHLDVPLNYWCDSTTALSWIRRNNEWGTFVGNRVKEICRISVVENWRHVPGISNPADLPSRGCSPKELLESK